MVDASKIAKLPKWARDHITVLEHREADLRERLSQWECPGDDALVSIEGHDVGKLVALPNAAIRIRSGSWNSPVIFRRDADGRIKVHIATAGRLVIEPDSANAITLNVV